MIDLSTATRNNARTKSKTNTHREIMSESPIARSLFPMATTAETDWEAHYDSVRVWFLGTLATLSSIAMLETWLFLAVPLTHAYRIVQAGLA